MLKPRKETKHDLQRAKDLRVQDIQDLQKKQKMTFIDTPFTGKSLFSVQSSNYGARLAEFAVRSPLKVSLLKSLS